LSRRALQGARILVVEDDFVVSLGNATGLPVAKRLRPRGIPFMVCTGQSRSGVEPAMLSQRTKKAVDRNGQRFFRINQGVKGAFGAAQRLHP
jgi:hypothetical protein